ncbi:Post-segregation antitoxin CcdA [compost metagenome]
MTVNPRQSTARPLDNTLLDEARALGLDVTTTAEADLIRAVKAEKERRWKIENADAIQAANDYVAKHGLPFAKYRQF